MRVLIATCLLLAGCYERLDPNEYALTVAPGFSVEEQAQVLGAAVAWREAVPELRLSVRLAPCNSSDICMKRGALDGEHPGITYYDPTVIVVDADSLEIRGLGLQTTATHELGHAFGLPHLEPSTIMCAFTGCQASSPTEADVAEYRRRH